MSSIQPNPQQTPIPLILDDDGSQDGLTALAFMLSNAKFDVQAVTISQGIADPKSFDKGLARILYQLGASDIPIGVGRSTPLAGNNAFPDFIREAPNILWSPFVNILELPAENLPVKTRNAAELIVEKIKQSPKPVAILATGSLTNIAEALRLDPSIINNISVLEILGGAVFVPGNLPVLPTPPFSTNTVAEFNIWVDPVAAQEVFKAGEKGLKIQLTPLDATNKISFDRADQQAWLKTATPPSKLAAGFLDFALTVIASNNDPNPVWDLVAAINLSEPDFSPETPLHIEVDTTSDPGATQGQTKVISTLSPNVLVSLNPSFNNISFKASEVFSALIPEPKLVVGSPFLDILNAGVSVDGVVKFDGIKDIVFTGAGNDEVDVPIGGSLTGNNIVDLGSGDDTIFVNKGDRTFGSDGNDTFDARDGQGGNRISGGVGDDTFYLGSNDRALGGDGKDIFRVSLGGGNLISGGAGADQFWIVNAELPSSANTVLDFQLGTDVIGIQGAVSLGITTSTLQLNQVGADTAIIFNNQTLATLTGIQASSLSLTDSKQFVFA